MSENITENKEMMNLLNDITKKVEEKIKEKGDIEIKYEKFIVKRDFQKNLGFEGRILVELIETQVTGSRSDEIRTMKLILYKTKAEKYIFHTKDSIDKVLFETAQVFNTSKELVENVLKQAREFKPEDRRWAKMFKDSLQRVIDFDDLLIEEIS